MPGSWWSFLKFLFIGGTLMGALFLFGGTLALLGMPAGGIAVLIVMAMFSIVWAFDTYTQYRQSRQEELRHVMLAAVESDIPLTAAIMAYVEDRPERGPIQLIFAACTIPFFPGAFLLWLWIWLTRFDRQVVRFVDKLEDGALLSEALSAVPSVLHRDVRLALRVGESTQHIRAALHRLDQHQFTSLWRELVPRLLYPAVLSWAIFSVTLFLTTMIVPKFKKIFDEFGMQLPNMTRLLIDIASIVQEFTVFLPLLFFGVVGLTVVLFASSEVRWYTPVYSWIYRRGVRSLVLKSLGLCLEAGQTLPGATRLLSENPELPGIIRRRLNRATALLEAGETVGTALANAQVLPRHYAGLLEISQKTQTLPMIFRELGDLFSTDALRMLRRVTSFVAPMLIIALGGVVGFIVTAMMLPLLKLLEGLSR
ncbi:MAG: type II secretion system F family protein [Gemmataceae bacterium]